MTIETNYVANDGMIFKTKEGCLAYEKQTESELIKEYNKLLKFVFSEYDLLGTGSDECEYDVVEIKDYEDLMTVNRILDLRHAKIRLSENCIGKEMMIFRDTISDNFGNYVTTLQNLLVDIINNYNNLREERKR